VTTNLIMYAGALRTYRKPLLALFASIQKSGIEKEIEPLLTERERRRFRKLAKAGELPFEAKIGSPNYRLSIEVWQALGLNCALALAVLQEVKAKARAVGEAMLVRGADFQVKYWSDAGFKSASYWNPDTTTEVLKKLESAGLIWRIHEIPADGRMVPVRRGLKINDVVEFPLDDDGEFRNVGVYLNAKPFLPENGTEAPLANGGTLWVPHDALEGFEQAWNAVEQKEQNDQLGLPKDWDAPY
jgi:hypothetical protein